MVLAPALYMLRHVVSTSRKRTNTWHNSAGSRILRFWILLIYEILFLTLSLWLFQYLFFVCSYQQAASRGTRGKQHDNEGDDLEEKVYPWPDFFSGDDGSN